MKNYQIKYTAQFTDGTKDGIYIIKADTAYEALQKFDWGMSENNNLKWILHREFINQE